MKKVGIITLYNGSNNYGGIAQAYALQKFLVEQGYNAELVSYKRHPRLIESRKDEIKKEGIIGYFTAHSDGLIKKVFKKLIEKPIECRLQHKYADMIKTRIKATDISRESIPHSREYTIEDIATTKDDYDIFITGSDQVWKPGVVQDPYVWSFVPKEKKCLSYSSSISTEVYPDWYKAYMMEHLEKYSWISVREKSAQTFIRELLHRNVDLVVDPTMLLNVNSWSEFTAQKHYDGDYIFAYLLGESYSQRRKVKKIAKMLGVPIITIPHVENSVRLCDVGFGDVLRYDVGLPEFLSLIKYAKLVVTDSFHAVVFSNIFETDFLVFDRAVIEKKERMTSRIDNILEILDENERKISEHTRITREDLLKQVDFNRTKNILNPLIRESQRKLLEVLD